MTRVRFYQKEGTMIGRQVRQFVAAMFVLSIVARGAALRAQPVVDLWVAVAGGDLDTVRRVLDAGSDPDVLEPNGATPLIVAAMFGHTDLVGMLAERKATLDVQDKGVATALHVAALFGHPDAITALLTAGAATDIPNRDGYTPLDLVRGPWSDERYGLYAYLERSFRWTWTSNESGRRAGRYARFFRLRADPRACSDFQVRSKLRADHPSAPYHACMRVARTTTARRPSR
jgi:hypothetical protein